MRFPGGGVFCTFISYNILGLVFGLIVVGITSWMVADKAYFFSGANVENLTESEKYQLSSVSVVDHGAYILIAVGAAIVSQSIFGCTGSLMGCCGGRYHNKARTCLITYGSLVAVVVIFEILSAILVLNVYRSHVEEKVEAFMNNTIVIDYTASETGDQNSVSVLWEHIMISLECCGVKSYKDFPEEIPLACCSSAPDNKCPEPGSPPLLQMERGCYPLLVAGTFPAVVFSLVIVTIFQVAGIVLSCCLARIFSHKFIHNKTEYYEDELQPLDSRL